MKRLSSNVKLLLLVLAAWTATPGFAWALGQEKYVEFTDAPSFFPLARGQVTATLYVDGADWPGVARAAEDLQADLNRVTGHAPAIVHDVKALSSTMVVIGTLGKSPLLDQLVREKKLMQARSPASGSRFFSKP